MKFIHTIRRFFALIIGLFFWSLQLSLLFGVVHGFPNFSGTCLQGPNMMPINTTHYGGNMGNLEDDGEFQLTLSGLGNLADIETIETKRGYVVVITSQWEFWGYFIRVSSSDDDNIDRSGSIAVLPNNNDALQIMESNGQGITRIDNNDELPAVCERNVAGASHVNVDQGRTRLSFILDVAEPGTINLEITMMYLELEWYYSSYTLNVVNPTTDPPTMTPTVSTSPTDTPVTTAAPMTPMPVTEEPTTIPPVVAVNSTDEPSPMPMMTTDTDAPALPPSPSSVSRGTSSAASSITAGGLYSTAMMLLLLWSLVVAL